MSNFQAGQKVKAVVSVTRYFEPQESIVEGTVYVVDRTIADGESVFLKGYTQFFDESRFVAYEEPKPVFDLTKPVETMEGKAVELVLTNARGDYPLKGYIGQNEGLTSWTADGKYFKGGCIDNYDLRNVAEKPAEAEYYFNVYKDGDGELSVGFEKISREVADRGNGGLNRVACVKVKFVEGTFDA